jgi:hypothetical protein
MRAVAPYHELLFVTCQFSSYNEQHLDVNFVVNIHQDIKEARRDCIYKALAISQLQVCNTSRILSQTTEEDGQESIH